MNGDAALDAGFDLVLPNDDVRDGWDEHNKDRDYSAQALGEALKRVLNGNPDANTISLTWIGSTMRMFVDGTAVGDIQTTEDSVRNGSAPTNQIELRWNGTQLRVVIDNADVGGLTPS